MEDDSVNIAEKILVFGGTFDPPHLAHAVLPEQASSQLGCDVILYVPAAVNPLKTAQPTASKEHRLAMLLLAIADVPNAKISTVELDRPGPSYMVETLRLLHHQYRSVVHRQPVAAMKSQPSRIATEAEQVQPKDFRLLIGADQALEFHRWKDWQQILTLATPAVMLRPPWDEESFSKALQQKYSPVECESWMGWTLRLPWMDMSATELRAQLGKGPDENTREWLDPAVLEYIEKNGLYRT